MKILKKFLKVGYVIYNRGVSQKLLFQARVNGFLIIFQIRELIETQPHISFEVRDDEGWFGTEFPQGVDELYFQVPGIVKDVDRLKSLYFLFALVLNQLCHIDSAYEDNPNVTLSNY